MLCFAHLVTRLPATILHLYGTIITLYPKNSPHLCINRTKNQNPNNISRQAEVRPHLQPFFFLALIYSRPL